MGSNVTQWLTALDRIAALDVDWVIPGHGEVVRHRSTSRGSARTCSTGSQAVSDAVAQGWTREETVERVNFAERYPVDIGQGYMMKHIQTLNAGSLWDKLTQLCPHERLPFCVSEPRAVNRCRHHGASTAAKDALLERTGRGLGDAWVCLQALMR